MQSPGTGEQVIVQKGTQGSWLVTPTGSTPILGAEVAATPSPGCHTLVGLPGTLPTLSVARTLCPTPTTSRSTEREILGELG